MRNITMDTTGAARCWNCGGRNFDHKRTGRAKITFGVAAVLSSKKMRCCTCGEYNDPGHAKPFTGPASSKYQPKTTTRPAGLTIGSMIEARRAKKAAAKAAAE